MRTLCLYFQVHQPFRFRRYRFFDIGNEHYYYDDYLNESILRRVAERCYLPANRVILELLKKYDGKFRISYSISGVALDQFELYAPEVIDSFRELAATGYVEFLSETYAHSLVALKDREEFEKQVTEHRQRIKDLFQVEPVVYRNTELIYSDEIGAMVASMGYKGMLTEGAKHILGWKSPDFLYANPINPRLKLLLRNYKLSDDIAFRFSNRSWSEWPLTAEKYATWLKELEKSGDTVNIFMDYETFGEHQTAETGILSFLKALPAAVFKHTKFTFSTPSKILDQLQPVAVMNVPYPISWADEERDLTAWLGNPLQEQAFNKLYDLLGRVRQINDETIRQDFKYLQVSDHFYYMCTKFFSDGEVHSYFNPYGSPYEAFINYMNVLSDFEIRLNAALVGGQSDEVRRLSKIITEKDEQIRKVTQEMVDVKSGNSSTRATKAKTSVKNPVKKAATRPQTGKVSKNRKAATGKSVRKSVKK